MIESDLLKQIGGYVGGRWITASDSGTTFGVINPATGEKLADVPALGAAETDRAVEAARAAVSPGVPIEERRERLRRIHRLLEDHKQELGRIITLEQGKPWPEAQVEVGYAAGFFRHFAEHVDKLAPVTLDKKPRGARWTVHHRPIGAVALITPWNFPIAMLAKKLSAALAADCPSIVKPAEQTPLTVIALFHLLDERLDLPPGFANLVFGPPEPIGRVFCEHPEVAAISFTGSTAVGGKLTRDTADQVKKLTLELGGNAPYLVFDSADLDAAADHLIKNKFRAAGQTCVCANRIYAQRGVLDAFADRVARRVGELKVGNGMGEGVDLGPLINRAGFDKVRRHVADALCKGAVRLVGDDPPEPTDDWGCFYPPTVLRDVTQDMACSREETFGPVVPILSFEDEAEAVRLSNDTPAGLAAYLFTGDDEQGERVAAQLRFGHVGINTGTGPTPEAPFGGMKRSGYGREGGIEGLFEFVAPQAIPHG